MDEPSVRYSSWPSQLLLAWERVLGMDEPSVAEVSPVVVEEPLDREG
ncbi:MAG TPA: hypothetical protein VFN02_06845 [Ktedonobacteraceae bacterium]|nr:hypothetical protein [Ktedonobacteraceae bacterium]